jgi:hypothetical protein
MTNGQYQYLLFDPEQTRPYRHGFHVAGLGVDACQVRSWLAERLVQSAL